MKGKSDLAWGGVHDSYTFRIPEIPFELMVLSVEGFFMGHIPGLFYLGGKCWSIFILKLFKKF